MKKHNCIIIVIIVFSYILIGCGSNINHPTQSESKSTSGSGIKIPTAILMNKTATIHSVQPSAASSSSNNSGQEWKITPFMVGEADYQDLIPGGKYYAIYFAIENIGNRLDYLYFEDCIPGVSSTKNQPFQPTILDAYIRTDDGHEYPEAIESQYYPSRCAQNLKNINQLGYSIENKQDELFFHYNFSPRQDNEVRISGWPPIPPGFKIYASMLFKLGVNTNGYTLVLPGIDEYAFDKINQPIKFPFDQEPTFIKVLGSPVKVNDNSQLTVENFSRTLDGKGILNFSLQNPTGDDLYPSNYKLYIFDDLGRSAFQSIRLDMSSIGRGQEMTYSVQFNFFPSAENLFLLITHDANIDAQGSYNAPWWEIFELK